MLKPFEREFVVMSPIIFFLMCYVRSTKKTISVLQ
jgi:hypothetical protein